jgi:NifU-like protein involved in Fe-S cluster formation
VKYNELTRRYFEHPGSVGELAGPDCFRGAAGNRAQGTWVQFDVRVAPARTISAVRFLAFGCPHVIAVASWIAEQGVGREIEPRLPESVQALRERFAAPIEKLGRLLIVEDAWIAAVRAGAGAGPGPGH